MAVESVLDTALMDKLPPPSGLPPAQPTNSGPGEPAEPTA